MSAHGAARLCHLAHVLQAQGSALAVKHRLGHREVVPLGEVLVEVANGEVGVELSPQPEHLADGGVWDTAEAPQPAPAVSSPPLPKHS
jgi:hypothetical protein